MANKRAIGTATEKYAVDFLKAQNYQIREENFRCRYGEIDIIAERDDYLIFIEVKYRSNNKFGYPMEAVTKNKQNKIIQVAKLYLSLNELAQVNCRFDVIEIYGGSWNINHVENAFWT